MPATFGLLLTAVLACPADPATAGPGAGGRGPGYWDFGIHRLITRGSGTGAKSTCGVLSQVRDGIETGWKTDGGLRERGYCPVARAGVILPGFRRRKRGMREGRRPVWVTHFHPRERRNLLLTRALMWTRELIGLRDRFQSRKCTVVQNTDKGGKGYDISFSLFPFLPPRAPQRSIVCELYKLGKAP